MALFEKLTPIAGSSKYGVCSETNKVYSLRQGGMTLLEVSPSKRKNEWKKHRCHDPSLLGTARVYKLLNDEGKRGSWTAR